MDETYAQLEAKEAETDLAVDAANVDAATTIDVPDNRVEVEVTDTTQARSTFDNTNIQLPEGVTLNKVDALVEPTIDIFGGLGLTYSGSRNYCTAGFSVRHDSGATGPAPNAITTRRTRLCGSAT